MWIKKFPQNVLYFINAIAALDVFMTLHHLIHVKMRFLLVILVSTCNF